MFVCVCVVRSYKREREKGANETADECVCVGGLLKLEHTAIEALHCEYKSTVKGHTSSLNEITIFQNKKKLTESRERCPTETC